MASEAPSSGHSLFMRPWIFVKSVPSMQFLPPQGPAEIAFAGRSNVGKSTLINALTRQKGLARASNTPGRTQELNYFIPEAQSDAQTERPLIAAVDMPGYGYAEAPKDIVARWTELVFDYLRGRVTLARVFLLIDHRHGIKANDLEVMDLLDRAAVTYQIVMTKSDKIGAGERERILEATQVAIKKRAAAFPIIIQTSSEKGWGIDELRSTIAEIARERLAR